MRKIFKGDYVEAYGVFEVSYGQYNLSSMKENIELVAGETLPTIYKIKESAELQADKFNMISRSVDEDSTYEVHKIIVPDQYISFCTCVNYGHEVYTLSQQLFFSIEELKEYCPLWNHYKILAEQDTSGVYTFTDRGIDFDSYDPEYGNICEPDWYEDHTFSVSILEVKYSTETPEEVKRRLNPINYEH